MAQLNRFLTEIWILYAIAVAFTALRVVARVRAVGWRGFEADDYLTLGAIVSTGLAANELQWNLTDLLPRCPTQPKSTLPTMAAPYTTR